MSEAQSWTPPPVGSPCWIEIPAVDVAACKKFYEGLFPTWNWKPSTEKYPEERIAMFSYAGSSGSAGLSGGIVQVEPDCKKGELNNGMGVTVYHFVKSIEETAKKVKDLGGESVSEKMPEGDMGWFMYIKDVAGNRFGIYEFKTS